MSPVRAPPGLRAAVVMDYQNVHLVGHEAFPSSRHGDRHECLVDPLLFAQQLLSQRNANQRPGFPGAQLRDLWVYRGLPSSELLPVPIRRRSNLVEDASRDEGFVGVVGSPSTMTTPPGGPRGRRLHPSMLRARLHDRHPGGLTS